MTNLPKTPSFKLDGKRALVTGAGRGIGLACAAALAEAGAHVVLAARSLDELEAAAGAIRASGGLAQALRLDVMDLAAVKAAIARAEPFDILVNNAGCNRPMSFVEVTEEDFDAVIDLNLKAAFFVAQIVAAQMIEAGVKGSIIHMSSQMGHVGGAQSQSLLRLQMGDRRPEQGHGSGPGAARNPQQCHCANIHRDAADPAVLRGQGFR